MSDISSYNSSYIQALLNSQGYNSLPAVITASLTAASAASVSSAATSSSGSNASTVNRLTGFSGFDVDGTVTKLMQPYQTKIDEAKQAQQTVEWQRELYTSIIGDIKKLQDTYLNSASPENNISSPSFFNTNSVSSSSNSVSATVNANANPGVYNISVNSLATTATLTGNTSLNTQFEVNTPSTWNGTGFSLQVNNGSPINISFSSISTDSAKGLSDIVSQINSQVQANPDLSGKVTASLVTDAGKSYIRFTASSGANVKIAQSNISDVKTGDILNFTTSYKLPTTSNGTLLINYGGSQPAQINVTAGEAVGQVISDIQSKTGGAVRMSIDDITGKISISNKSTGSTSNLSISDDQSGAILRSLGLTSDNNISSISAHGTDANITITNPNGSSQTISSTTNNPSFNGLNLTLNSVTPSGSPASVTITQDVNKVYQKFKNFMDSYNNIVSEIRDKMNEVPDRKYPPLTDAQKSKMTDSDIKLWNDKAKTGLLRNDDYLSKMLSDLKDSFFGTTNVSAMTFGPGTKDGSSGLDLSNDYTADGTIVFSDSTGDTFKKALQNHMQDVINMFTTPCSDDTLKDDKKLQNEGIAQRLSDIITNNVGMAGIDQAKSSILGKMAFQQDNYDQFGFGGSSTFLDQIYQYSLKIAQLQSDFSDKQTAYYTQFSKMEQSLNNLNAQQAALQQQLGGGNG